MKTPSQDLFELIKSLSKSEKRYFRLMAGFHSGNKCYLRLFGAIQRQSRYNEPALLEKFRKEKFIKNFSVAKSYLYNHILRALKIHGSYKDLDSDHSEMIESIKVLEYKGLFSQVQRAMRKAKQITYSDEGYLRHYYLLNREYITASHSLSDASMEKIEDLIGERKKVLHIIENYSFVADILFIQEKYLRSKRYCRTKAERAQLKKIVSPLLSKNHQDMLSATALGLFNRAVCGYYNAIGLPEKAVLHSGNYLVHKPGASPDKIEIQTISELFAHLMLCLRNRFLNGYLRKLTEFRARMINLKNKQRFVVMYEKWYLLSLAYFNNVGDFNAGNSHIASEKNNVNKYEVLMTKQGRISIYYAIAYHQFCVGNHKGSLKWLGKIINDTGMDVEEYSFAKILLIMVYFEMQDQDRLEYAVRSTYRHLLKRGRLYESEKLIMQFIRKYSHLSEQAVLRSVFEELRDKLETKLRHPAERSILYYCDFISWLESKISGIPFDELIRKKGQL